MWKENDPCPQPFQLNASTLEPCNNLGAYDYFTNSEIGFVYSCVFLAFVPILGILAAYGVVKLQNSKRRRLKLKQESLKFVEMIKKIYFYFKLLILKLKTELRKAKHRLIKCWRVSGSTQITKDLSQ